MIAALIALPVVALVGWQAYRVGRYRGYCQGVKDTMTEVERRFTELFPPGTALIAIDTREEMTREENGPVN